MSLIAYRHPETMALKQVDSKNEIQVATLEKLGYVVITAADIRSEPSISVTYEPVTKPKAEQEPPALPKLTEPVPPGPTHDTGEKK